MKDTDVKLVSMHNRLNLYSCRELLDLLEDTLRRNGNVSLPRQLELIEAIKTSVLEIQKIVNEPEDLP